jgi:toxin YoeB
VNYRIVYTKVAAADIPNLKAAHLAKKAQLLLGILADNPFQNPPPYEKLRGSLQGAYSRRLNIQHRLVYQVLEDEHVVKIISMWTHYEF